MLARSSRETAASKAQTHATSEHASKRPPRESSPAFRLAQNQRQILLEKLEDEDADDLSIRLGKCGEIESLTCTCCGERWDVSKRCNRKWCPVCVRALATRRALRYTKICEKMQWPIFVTLTVKNFTGVETDFVRFLLAAFKKLRRLRWFKRKVKGGIVTCEVTNSGNGWHVHLHLLLDCHWLSVNTQPPRFGCSAAEKKSTIQKNLRELNEQWELCTRRPSTWKVKRAGSKDGNHGKSIAHEILKYAVKGSDLIDCEEPIAPVLRMLDASRLMAAFGNCYGHVTECDVPKIPTACGGCGRSGQWITQGAVEAMVRQGRKKR